MGKLSKITRLAIAVLIVFGMAGTSFAGRFKKTKLILKADDYKHYVDYFNRMEDENIIAAIPNSKFWDWMKANIPLFECPQDNF